MAGGINSIRSLIPGRDLWRVKVRVLERHDIIKKRLDTHGNVIETRQDGIGSPTVYALSKHLTEEATFKFAKENIDITSIVAGPFFTANVPSSVKVLLSPLTGLS
ncbi:uncharacterized protein LOC130718264 isoform X2 [Lotus japonicus]|uniref:uncharacterized protein LOC130718264 isoform X2 n=1 Tax=Lotus japonicus TaxID=34305 RepID=UPI00258D7D16|nr:uncharacterized protein LOC130718264 isoform X2 [Lotus japonicus]